MPGLSSCSWAPWRVCIFSLLCSACVSSVSTQQVETLDEIRAERSQRDAVLQELWKSSATADQLQKLLDSVSVKESQSSPGSPVQSESQSIPAWLYQSDQRQRKLDDKRTNHDHRNDCLDALAKQDEPKHDQEFHDKLTRWIRTTTIGIAICIVTMEIVFILIHFGIIPKYGFKVSHDYTDLDFSSDDWRDLEDQENPKVISDNTYLAIVAGAADQAWCEELGLCETKKGVQLWFGKSQVDPSQSHAEHAASHEIHDPYAWCGDKESRVASVSSEEKRLVTLHRNFLERERYLTTTFRKLIFRQLWSSEPGSYPGPSFQTRAEFTEGCQPGNWPIPSHKNVHISDLTPLELVHELRNFIWRNNAEGSRKATFLAVLLGSSVFPSIFIFGQIVDIISNVHDGIILPYFRIPVHGSALLMLMALAKLLLEIACAYMCYAFWTVLPKYSVLRQFQSFFGRQCMEILMSQSGAESKNLKNAHENLFKDSPGLCQAMANYCCEGVVLNLWGKSFNNSQAIASLFTSVLLVLYAFTKNPLKETRDKTWWECIAWNIERYGFYLILFTAVSCACFLLNVFSRLKESVDMWGAATKTKLNMMALQNELAMRMMHIGKSKKEIGLTADDEKILGQVGSDWHDACRIYCSRDFHTWFVSWIVTENSNKMIHAASLAMVVLVLGCDVLDGNMTAGTFVVIFAAVEQWNTAFMSVLTYYYSLPEGYICLLYLAQVCNLISDPSKDHKQIRPDAHPSTTIAAE